LSPGGGKVLRLIAVGRGASKLDYVVEQDGSVGPERAGPAKRILQGRWGLLQLYNPSIYDLWQRSVSPTKYELAHMLQVFLGQGAIAFQRGRANGEQRQLQFVHLFLLDILCAQRVIARSQCIKALLLLGVDVVASALAPPFLGFGNSIARISDLGAGSANGATDATADKSTNQGYGTNRARDWT
jgi:hypothetical protein